MSDLTTIVIFGASGDLTRRKLIPALFDLYCKGSLPEKWRIVGVSRSEFSNEAFRDAMSEGVAEFARFENNDAAAWKEFARNLSYQSCDVTHADEMCELDEMLRQAEGGGAANRLYYLSIAPRLYEPVLANLGAAEMTGEDEGWRRVVIEKPFGHDLASAETLNAAVHEVLDESQVYRIDHYLGKETVQNIMVFRFANSLYEPVWNRNYIDHVQITIAETVGVEHRAGYYDTSGALRDMFQNHMLQMLTLVAMAPPISFEADRIRDEKVRLLRSIRPFDLNRLNEYCVRGQYGPGSAGGKQVKGYLEESGINPQSKTETFVATKLFIDNWRWQGVPFYLRTGKRLAAKDTEIAVTFKKVPYSLFSSVGLDELPANILVFQIQPEEGISLSFQAKRPGSKLCMSTLDMNFSYESLFSVSLPDPYKRLLLDCMVGDQTLFTRQDDVEASWRLLTPVLQAWEADESSPYPYPAGRESFDQADRLIATDGRQWRNFVLD